MANLFRAEIKLTKEIVDRATPSPAPYWDSELPGFGLSVGSSGTKTFFVRYRPKGTGRDGLKRRVTIGRYGALTPAEARTEAKRILGLVAIGCDPAADAAKARAVLTVEQLGERYLAELVRPKKKPGTAKLYELYLRRHVFPAIGGMKADAVTRATIQKLHLNIGATRRATANRVRDMLSGVFAFGARSGFLPEDFRNPAKGIEKFRETARERFLNTEELERLGAALREAETVGVSWGVDETKPNAKHAPKPENRKTIVSPFATAAIRLLLFTGARLREILHLKWSSVDAERGLLFLPDSKTGRKTIVIGAPALAVIGALPRASAFVIAGDDPAKPRTDLHRPWRLISERAGLAGVRIHDLRHSFAATGAGASLGLPILGRLLGHASPSTTQRYAHLADDPLRRAADTIGATIAAHLQGRSDEKANIVPIPKAKQR